MGPQNKTEQPVLLGSDPDQSGTAPAGPVGHNSRMDRFQPVVEGPVGRNSTRRPVGTEEILSARDLDRPTADCYFNFSHYTSTPTRVFNFCKYESTMTITTRITLYMILDNNTCSFILFLAIVFFTRQSTHQLMHPKPPNNAQHIHNL